MPAAVSENTPRALARATLANRRCSERRAVGDCFGTNDATENQPGFGRVNRKRSDAPKRSSEPPGGKRRRSRPNRPPDGTGRLATASADPFRFGETRPIACPVHVAVARRRAEQEVDPRFSRLAALTLVNQMECKPSGDRSRSSRGHTANASV
jgi:hypothetical protein